MASTTPRAPPQRSATRPPPSSKPITQQPSLGLPEHNPTVRDMRATPPEMRCMIDPSSTTKLNLVAWTKLSLCCMSIDGELFRSLVMSPLLTPVVIAH